MSGYDPSLPSKTRELDLYCLLSPYQDDLHILNILWHEFGHSFVNPFVTSDFELVNESEFGKRSETQLNKIHEYQEFIFIQPLAQLIKNNEKQDKQFSTFESYLPAILIQLTTFEASDFMPKDSDVL